MKKTKKYCVLVFGCQMNKSDAEKIEAIFSQLGYIKTDSEKSADLIAVVACSVRQSAIDRVYGKSHNWQSRRKKGELFTILTGCVLDKDKNKMSSAFDLVLDVKEISEIPKKLTNLKTIEVKDYFHLETKHQSNFQAYVPIMTGCNNFCSYCVVPYVRGREVSRPAEEIISECQKLIDQGYKEITLLGQNVNSYNHKSTKARKHENIDFSKLLSIIDEIHGDYWLRFVTSHPKDLSADLIKVMAGGKHIVPYLHLAVQSGDDQILKLMNRQYTVAKYLKLIKKARQAIPGVMISTDIIVGFPTETKQQHSNTVKLLKQVGYDMAYIVKYSSRPQTASAQMANDVSQAEKEKRFQELNKVLAKSIVKNNQKLIGQTIKVLVEECRGGKCVGKTATFKTVTFSGDDSIVGKFIDVKITATANWGLIGELAVKKLIVILGPTACGKTQIATKLADKYDGEIISADSRQVFKGMDIGTGKDLKDYKIGRKKISYHLIDVVDPKTEFNVAKYQKLAYEAIDNILQRGRTPFLVGGTGLYLDAVTKGYAFPKNQEIKKSRNQIRKKLNALTVAQLLVSLKKIDPATYKIIDQKNRRRVQRALEIYYETGLPKSAQDKNNLPPYEILFVGIKYSLEKIYHKIDSRLEARIQEGMINEVKKLRKNKVGWQRLDDFGLEYRWVSRHLRGLIDYSTMVEKLRNDIHHFAKRQLTWFRRNENIVWVDNIKDADLAIKKFLNK